MDPCYSDAKRNKDLFDRYYAIADGDYGIPNGCPCGGRIIEEISQTESDLGRRYFTCNVFENDGFHIRKIWVHAIEEEVSRLRKEVDEQSEKIRSFGHHDFQIEQMRMELKRNGEEIAKLKELLAGVVGRIDLP